jgi:hypothetical protein
LVAKFFPKLYNKQMYKIGDVGNPNGRPVGSRNNRTKEVIQKLIANGFKDPLIVLGEIVTQSEDAHLRAQAANMLAPYLHGKHGMIPAPIYIEAKVHLPHPTPAKLDECRANINYLTLKLSAQIDTATADNLILDQRHLHDSLFEEMKLLYSQGGGTDVTIHIEGGLPPLPGTNIIAPDINGHAADPHMLLDSDHGRVDLPPQPPTIDSTAVQAPTQSAENLAVQPCGAATKVPPAQNNAPALSPGALAGNGPPPVQPQPPPLRSQVPQNACDIQPEHRAKYLAERQPRFPNVFQWDGHLWIDPV